MSASSVATKVPVRVCFVCTGNICRSPMAEVVFRRHLEDAGLSDQVVVDSAGTGGWHIGADADRRAISTLRNHGYAISHRARRFDAAWFDRLNLVVALDEGHVTELQGLVPPGAHAEIRLLREFDPAADPGDLDLPDPYYGDGDGFVRTLELIEAAMPGLLAETRRLLAVAENG